MKLCRALKDEIVLADEIRIADRFFQRLVGLLRDKSLKPNQGLLLKKCSQVHTIGMKFPIDVIFLSKEGEILFIENNMKKGRMSAMIKGAYWCLELMGGVAEKQQLTLHNQIIFESLAAG